MIRKVFLTLLLLTSFRAFGEDVTIIGDSLTVGSERYIRYFIPSAVVDAKVGRKFQEVMGIIRELEETGRLRNTVVIALATNSQISIEELVYVTDYLTAKGRRVILVNTKVPRKWEEINNYNMYLMKVLKPNIEVVDWKRISEYYCRVYICFRSDGYHLTDVGSYMYSYAIYYHIKNRGTN